MMIIIFSRLFKTVNIFSVFFFVSRIDDFPLRFLLVAFTRHHAIVVCLFKCNTIQVVGWNH